MKSFNLTNKKCWVVENIKTISYQVIQTLDLFNVNNTSLLHGRKRKEGKVFIVIEEIIYEHYFGQIINYFNHHKIQTKIYKFNGGEKNKNMESFVNIFTELDDFQINRRNEPIIAIGGGVLIDVVGFVSSCFRRGVPHIRVPTTLMGYIDAAIGIKTGINFRKEKNRMGSFEPAMAVILDTQFLKTLNRKHIVNGCGEILKIGISKNKDLFALLENEGKESIENKFQTKGHNILDSAIEDMLTELEPNLYEDSLERIVDFGHSFSPIIEMQNLYYTDYYFGVDDLLHGEAVAIDISFSVFLSHYLGYLSMDKCERICNLIRELNLPLWNSYVKPDILWEGLEERIYHRDGFQRVPIPDDIGHCVFLNNISKQDINNAYRVYLKYLKIEQN